MDVRFDVVSLVEEVAHGLAKASGGTPCFFVANVETGFLKEPNERKAGFFAVADDVFFVGFLFPQGRFGLVEFTENFKEPFGEVRIGFEGFFEFSAHVGEAGGATGFLAPGFLKAAVFWVNFVGVAAEDAFKVFADPVKEVVVVATEGPVEDDVSVESFVEPEAPTPGGIGFVGITKAGLSFVSAKVSALKDVALHEVDENSALVGEMASSVAHGLFGEVDSMAALVELALAVVGKVVEEAIANDFPEEI